MSQLSRCENNSWLNVCIRADKADTVKPKMKIKSKSKVANPKAKVLEKLLLFYAEMVLGF
jgi:hypothetical protein